MSVAIATAIFLFPPSAFGVVSTRRIAIHCFDEVFDLFIFGFNLIAQLFNRSC